ncbi:MAG: hypothetical protein MR016_11430 [Agathobacter sp.]|nr:hypothetical protein [Agathobacter sp.]
MKKKRILWGLLILCCILFVRPTESKAADDVYTINISKTSPAAAEKKLRKMKASSTQELQLTIDITSKKGYKNDVKKYKVDGNRYVNVIQVDINEANEEIAKEKLVQWLKKYQKLKANTYGVLPTSSDPDLKRISSGCYELFTPRYVSDYVNMNTICKKAYKATEGKCEYLGNYFDKIVAREQFSYLDTYNGGKRIKVDTTNGIINITEMLKDVPVKQYTKAELKKQSDSVRVQVLLYGVSKAQLFTMSYDSAQETKRSLYDLARGKAVMCPSDTDDVQNRRSAFSTWVGLAYYLSTDMKAIVPDRYSFGIAGSPFGAIAAKNSSSEWDYFDVDGTTFRPASTTSSIYSHCCEYPSTRKESQIKPVYNWITKGKATEADSFYLKKALKLFKDGTYVDYLMEHCGYGPNDKPIKLKLVNKNKTKYGFTSASYTLSVYEDENQQTAWNWVLNK